VALLRPTETPDPPILPLAPFTASCSAGEDGRARAYVCHSYSCRLPTSDPEEMLRLMQQPV
jgi:hypothetical protein